MSQLTFLKPSLTLAIASIFFTFIVQKNQPANAASFTAVDVTAPTINFTNGAWSLGFQFRTNKTVNISALGFYDDFKNDLTQTHDVGIFDDLGNLLVQGTVSPGDSLDGYFRYTSVPSTQLQAGRSFFIAAATGSERYTFNPIGFLVDPNISFVSSAFRFSQTLVFPGPTPGGPQRSDGNLGYFGPNFKADEATAVPTPVLLPSLIGLGVGVWRTRKAVVAKRTNDCCGDDGTK